MLIILIGYCLTGSAVIFRHDPCYKVAPALFQLPRSNAAFFLRHARMFEGPRDHLANTIERHAIRTHKGLEKVMGQA